MALEVILIGYSFPATDMAAQVLSSVAPKDLPREDIKVVHLYRKYTGAETTPEQFRSLLGKVPDKWFQFECALKFL